MKRWERKQQIKQLRLAQKEARKRKREEAGGAGTLPASGVTDAASAPIPAADAAATQTAGEAPAPHTLLPAYTVEEAVEDVAKANTEARDSLKQSKLVSADEAAELLSVAARQLSNVIDAGHKALSQVSPQRLREATEVINAQPVISERLAARIGYTPSGTAQQQPRRGTDPVITLMKLMVQAVSLLQRVLNRLHPRLRMAA